MSISKVRVSDTYRQAVFHGGQLGEAEELLKSSGEGDRYRIAATTDTDPGDYRGFTCHWQDIHTHKEHTAAVVVSFRVARAGYDAIHELDMLLSGLEGGFHPLEVSGMRPGGRRSSFLLAPYVAARGRVLSFRYLLGVVHEVLTVAVMKACIRLNIPLTAGLYKVNRIREQNIGSTDYRKIDGSLKMMLALTGAELVSLREVLDRGFRGGTSTTDFTYPRLPT